MKEIAIKDIWKSIQKGDEASFDELFRTYYKYLVSISYKYLNDFERSRDITQDVFMDIWKRRETIQIKESVKYFLRRAVINKCLAEKRNTTKMIYDSEVAQQSDASTDDVNEQFLFNDLNNQIKNIISNLPDRCREVFELSRFKNYSHKEIANELNISVKTIENQMTKALKFIRIQLKELGLLSINIIISFII